MDRRAWLTLAPLAVLATPRRAAALAYESFGNEPLAPGQCGLRADATALANLPGRAYMVVGGFGVNATFYFRGEAATAAAAVNLFGRLTATSREVRLAAGPGEARSFQNKPVGYDFLFNAASAGRDGAGYSAVLIVRLTATAVPPADVTALVSALDSPRFAERDAATRELARLGRAARPGLRAARGVTPSAEVRERIDALLARTTGTDVSDLALPDGLTVVAADEPGATGSKAIRDDIARFVASRRPEVRK